jgi:hypothetical protein
MFGSRTEWPEIRINFSIGNKKRNGLGGLRLSSSISLGKMGFQANNIVLTAIIMRNIHIGRFIRWYRIFIGNFDSIERSW